MNSTAITILVLFGALATWVGIDQYFLKRKPRLKRTKQSEACVKIAKELLEMEHNKTSELRSFLEYGIENKFLRKGDQMELFRLVQEETDHAEKTAEALITAGKVVSEDKGFQDQKGNILDGTSELEDILKEHQQRK